MAHLLCRDDKTNTYYVRIDVLERVVSLINLQRTFYRTRDKKTLQECKAREDALLAWADSVFNTIRHDGLHLTNE